MALLTAMAISVRLAILAALAAGPALAQAPPPAPEVPPCRPQSIVGMTVRNITPGIAASDPRAQPKRLWRLGAKFLRSLESPVAPGGDQAMIIVAEPDIWTINTANGIGRHSLDPGPILEVRAPIPPPSAPSEFMALEYGCELEFVTVRAPVAQRTIRWGGINAGVHTYAVGEHSLAILMDDQRGEPLMISYIRQGKPILVLRYDGYRRGLRDMPDLFRPPAGVTISEGKDPPPRQPTPLD